MGVSDEIFLSSEKNNLMIIKDVVKLPSSSSTKTMQDDQDQNKGHESRNFELIKVNNLLNNDNNKKLEIFVDDEDDDHNNNDGFKTPTAIENKIKVNYSCPPPAPIKPVAKSMKRRRFFSDRNKPVMMRCLHEISREDIDSLFPPRSVVLVQDQNKIISNNNNNNNNNNNSNNRIIKKANFSTLMSFR